MKNTILSFKTIALAGSIFLLASCQKEQVATLRQQTAVESGTVLATDQSTMMMSADSAFDMAAMQIMQHMMQQMSSMHMTCDPDIDFDNMMIVHHDAGIQMSDAELMYGHDPKAKMLAQQAKQGNIESKHRLEAYLATNPAPHPLSKMDCMSFMKQMDKSMQAMMAAMTKASNVKNVDVDFATQMMVHHAGALGMARVELKWGRYDTTLTEARKIIKDQAKEILEYGRYVKQKVAGN